MVREGTIEEWNWRYAKTDKAKITKIFFPIASAAQKNHKTHITDTTNSSGIYRPRGIWRVFGQIQIENHRSMWVWSRKENILHFLTDCLILSRARVETENRINKNITIMTIPENMNNKQNRTYFTEFCDNVTRVTRITNGSNQV